MRVRLCLQDVLLCLASPSHLTARPQLSQAALRARLAEVEKEIKAASEQRYLEGLARANGSEVLEAPRSSPIFEPFQDDLPSPARDEESGEVIERTWHARADLEGVSAEGSGREILLQASPCSWRTYSDHYGS